MDDRRFDQLVRMIGQGASRRSILKGLMGVGGAVLSGAMAEQADARTIGTRPTVPPPPPLAPTTTTLSPTTTTTTDPCTGYRCGLECCATAEQCCDLECCGPNGVCLARIFGEINGIEEEVCCAIPQTCDAQCCSGDCYDPAATVVDEVVSPLLLPARSCCPEEGTLCAGAEGTLCCEGATPECCVRDGIAHCINRQLGGCCEDGECPDSPEQCRDGICRRDSQTCGLSDETTCSDGVRCCNSACCPGTTWICCEQETAGGPAEFCLDLADNQCCETSDCGEGEQCCGLSCCDEDRECCGAGNDAFCCSDGKLCCAGQCCPGTDHICCDSGLCAELSEGECCENSDCEGGDICCGNHCCPSDECCGSGNDAFCCSDGKLCCAGQCCPGTDHVCCDSGLCAELSEGECCENSDCEGGDICCGNHCCPSDECCGSGNDAFCCSDGKLCCAGQCCPGTDHVCCDNGVCADSELGECCSIADCGPGELCCENLCLLTSCCPGEVCAAAEVTAEEQRAPECTPRDVCLRDECGEVSDGCSEGGTIFCGDCPAAGTGNGQSGVTDDQQSSTQPPLETTPAPPIPDDGGSCLAERERCASDDQCCAGLCRGRNCGTRGRRVCRTDCGS